jgi:GNAT superfamily N-acetyltransferase
MSIESALERFPKEIQLKDGSTCTLRPVAKSDAKGLNEFFLSLPGYELMFLKERVTEPSVVKELCAGNDPHSTFVLVAVKDKQIVGECALRQVHFGWKRHIGDITAHTHPSLRGKGLGRLLVSEMIEVARESGLERLEAEFIGKQEGAMKVFGLLGFSTLMRLEDYVKDMQAVTHDYVLMGMRLVTDEEYAGMG